MSWANDRIHQDLSSTGKYNASSALAKQYAGLEEDGSSRVDDGEGWREIKRDNPPKNAAEYEQLVKDYAKQGFDVKAIDMDGDDFAHSNIAIKPSDAAPEAKEVPVELSPRLATAKARAAQYEEDRVNGQAAKDLYDSENNPAEGFLERYKIKLGDQLDNGMYRDKKHTTSNSSRVASGANDVSMDAAEFARTGKDNREGY